MSGGVPFSESAPLLIYPGLGVYHTTSTSQLVRQATKQRRLCLRLFFAAKSMPCSHWGGMEICYMCEAAATSREHVPPRCIFPRGDEHRKSLITVPNCDVHNSTKSKSDEYLRHVLVCSPGVNETAAQVARESLVPSFERRPHIMETFLTNVRPVTLGTDETGAFTVDVRRFESAVSSIIRGLYFHETGQKLRMKITVLNAAFCTSDLRAAPHLAYIRETERKLPDDYRGANQRAFRYALHYQDDSCGLCRMRFYDGHPIYGVWGGRGLRPPSQRSA